MQADPGEEKGKVIPEIHGGGGWGSFMLPDRPVSSFSVLAGDFRHTILVSLNLSVFVHKVRLGLPVLQRS